MKTKETAELSLDTCLACGGEVKRGMYTHVEQVGRWKVSDATGARPLCTKCGEAVLTLDDLAAYQQRAARTALLEGKLEGAVLRYARKALGLTQKELAEALDAAPETISRWENDHDPFEQTTALALGFLLSVAADGVPVRDLLEEFRRRRGAAAQARPSDPGALELSVPQPRARKAS